MDEVVQTQEASSGPVEKMTSTERMIPQSSVDNLVVKAKQEAYERARRDAEEAARSQRQAQEVPHATLNASQTSMGGMPQLTQEQIRQMIAEESHKRALHEHYTKFANDFVAKLDHSKTKYDPKDFDETIQDLNLEKNPQLIELTGGIENAGDVIYHLGKYPNKATDILSMYNDLSPKLAQKAMYQLAESLKNNESASNTPRINEPLSQMKRSVVGADTGKRTVADLRKDPRYRR